MKAYMLSPLRKQGAYVFILQGVVAHSTVMVLVFVGCVFLGTWYSLRIHSIVSKMHSFAKKMSDKTDELSEEKKKTDR